ncbi:hypothetical protein [Lactovum odontotermitis]
MANLANYSNLYADLAQAAYTKRPISFPDGEKFGGKFDFSKLPNGNKLLGGDQLPNNGIVHLQPAIKISTHIYTSLPNPNDSYYNPKIFREAAA